jgi:hypothetical protein
MRRYPEKWWLMARCITTTRGFDFQGVGPLISQEFGAKSA